MMHISEILGQILGEVDLVVSNSANVGSAELPNFMGVATGFSDLDQLTAGLQRADLIVVAGVPQIGKTSLALGMAYGAAIGHMRKVGFFSLDLSAEQLVQRLLSMETGVDCHRIRLGQINDNEWDRIARAFGRLIEAPIYVEDSTATSVENIRFKACAMRSERGLDMIIVDYMQLIETEFTDDRSQQFYRLSRELKWLARDLKVPVVVLVQLPEETIRRRISSRPLLADLRDAGSIDEEADLILLVHREDKYEEDSEKKGVAEIIIAKHRNGPVGIVNLHFFDRTARFADLELYPGPGM